MQRLARTWLFRLLESLILLALLSLALFALMDAMPGSAEDALLAADPELSADDVARIRAARGLDRPLLDRYRCWLTGRGAAPPGEGPCAYWPSAQGVLGGDLGHSSLHKRPVSELLLERTPRTLALMVPAFVLALLLSIAAGARAALYPGSRFDRGVRALCSVGLALPTHWLALLAVMLFAVRLRWLPVGGISDPDAPGLGSALAHLVLPVLVLTAFFAARWTRHVRGAALEAMGSDYVSYARAKGRSAGGALLKHALPNALFPLAGAVAQSIPGLFSGSLVVETVFSYPGVGVLIAESREVHDHLVSIVVLLAYATLALFSGTVADLLARALDPRVREAA